MWCALSEGTRPVEKCSDHASPRLGLGYARLGATEKRWPDRIAGPERIEFKEGSRSSSAPSQLNARFARKTRNPRLAHTDLSLWQRIRIGGRVGISTGLTVLNVFDSDTVTRCWRRAVVQDLPVTNADFASGFDYHRALGAFDSSGLDPAFDLPDTFQPPRGLRLTFKLGFRARSGVAYIERPPQVWGPS